MNRMKVCALAALGMTVFGLSTSPTFAADASAPVVACVGPNGELRLPSGGACKPTETARPIVNAQMRIDTLNGNNPTTIFAFSLGATNSSSSTENGGGAGRPTFANLTVSKMLDADSVPLLQAAATGQIFRRLVIDVFAAGSTVPFATYTFEDVLVASNVIGSTTSAVNEEDAFDFRRITSDVTLNGQTFHSCFDIKALTSCS